MAHALDVDQFDVVAGREVLDVGHAVDDGEAQAVVEDIESAGLGDLGGKCGDTLVETAKRFGLAEVIEEHGLEAAHRVFATVGAQRTVDVAVVGGEQLIEDVHAQIACAVGHHVVDVHQQVILPGCRHQLSPDQRLVAHDVERAAKAVVGILLEVGFGHLAAHHGQRLVLIDILAGLAILVDQEARFQLLPCREDGLKGGLHAVEVDVVTQGHDTGNVILHHLRILHAVIKHAKLRLEQWIEFQSLIIKCYSLSQTSGTYSRLNANVQHFLETASKKGLK